MNTLKAWIQNYLSIQEDSIETAALQEIAKLEKVIHAQKESYRGAQDGWAEQVQRLKDVIRGERIQHNLELRMYGQHTQDCQVVDSDYCTCGWETIWRRITP